MRNGKRDRFFKLLRRQPPASGVRCSRARTIDKPVRYEIADSLILLLGVAGRQAIAGFIEQAAGKVLSDQCYLVSGQGRGYWPFGDPNGTDPLPENSRILKIPLV